VDTVRQAEPSGLSAVLGPPEPRRFALGRDPLRREDEATLNIARNAVRRAGSGLRAGRQGRRDGLQKLAPLLSGGMVRPGRRGQARRP